MSQDLGKKRMEEEGISGVWRGGVQLVFELSKYLFTSKLRTLYRVIKQKYFPTEF